MTLNCKYLQKVPKGVKAGRVDRRLNGRKGFSREEAKNAKALTDFLTADVADENCFILEFVKTRRDAAGTRRPEAYAT